MSDVRRVRLLAGAGLGVAASLAIAACGGSSHADTNTLHKAVHPEPVPSTWELPGSDLGNSRFVAGPINASNVAKLGVAWTVPIKASGPFGGYSSTPVVANGVMYTEDLASNLEAVNFQTGKILWRKNYNSPDGGPNGVTFADGAIYGVTATSAFALRASDGGQIWIRKLTQNGNESVAMAPGVDHGTVYVSSVPGNHGAPVLGDSQAILTAMDARTGAVKWTWAEVPADLWSAKHKKINAGGGQWHAPSFDSAGNVYIGVANPGPFTGTPKFPWGSSRPGPNLYTDSIVKLDANTGKLVWFYQLTPHDIYDWDLQNSPILTTVGGRQIVIDGGKAGILVAVDAQTGKLMWKRSVGVHNGHDADNIAAENHQFSKLKLPETIEPGDLGGIESELASNGTTVFAAVNNLPTRYNGQGFAFATFPVPPGKGTGEFVAVDEATGRVKWDDKLASSPYGGATIANHVVFTTTYDGMLHAFDTDTGKEVWSTKLSAGTNSPVAVVGDTLIAAGTLPAGKGEKAEIIAYRLGATGKLQSATPAAPPRAASSSGARPSTGNTVSLTPMDDMLMYDTHKLTAKAGKVTVKFTNNSNIQHDVVLVDTANKTLGKTPVFSGGTKSFTVNLKRGTYTYYCSVPGHRQAGMQGTLTVN